MKTQVLFLVMTSLLLGLGCSSQSKDASVEPAPVAVETPTLVPVREEPKTDLQACDGKAAKDACGYTAEAGEVKGSCVRSETLVLRCLPKRSKKK